MMIKKSFPDVRTDLNPQVFFLLDMTGSMGVDKPATIDAFNEYIGGLKANEGTAGFKFSLAVFNSDIGIGLNIEKGSLTDVPELNDVNYAPAGTTPLYDAIGLSIDSLEEVQGQVLFIILTDGEENASQQFDKEEILKRISNRTEQGWKFVFLGCDIDAMKQSEDLGIAPGNARSYSRDASQEAMGDVVSATVEYSQRAPRDDRGFFEK